MKSKLKHLLAGAILVLPFALQAFTGMQAVAADDKPSGNPAPSAVTVELHKLGFDGQEPDITNTGKIQTIDGGTPLHGVEFTVTDVTAGYFADSLKGKSSGERISDIKDNAATYAQSGTPITDGVKATDEKGIVDFSLPIKSAVKDYTDKYAVYLIRETKSVTPTSTGNGGKSVIKVADPIVLVMPLSESPDNDGKIHIYPKNETKNTISKDLTNAEKQKDGSDGENSVKGFGDTVDYQVNVTIPSDIASLDSFGLKDTPAVGLDITDLSKLKLTDGTADLTALVTPTPIPKTDKNGTGFDLAFNDLAKLSAYAGKTLTLTYTATVTALLKPGETLQNSVMIPNNPTPYQSNTPITEGGAKFLKQDVDSHKGVVGAVFALAKLTKDNKLLYAHRTDTGYSWTDDSKDAVTATSAQSGAFEFTGLQYSANEAANDDNFSSYVAVETKAPDGYILPTGAAAQTKFTVDKDSYTDTDTKAVVIDNTPKGILPHTGGMGIYVLIVVGLAVMAGAFFFLKKSNRHEEV